MKFSFTKEQKAFRQEVIEFLEKEVPKSNLERINMSGGTNQEFSKKMAAKGWIGITWPKEYGGAERPFVEKMILSEECIRYRAPLSYHFGAERQIGPGIIAGGQQWQKDYFLPRFINAEDNINFCLLFSEPDAGSDLAAVKTTAVPKGDHYVVNGQKIWNSGAHNADWGWMIARTHPDPELRGHVACSEFIVDMKTPGITVRPILNILGKHSFNEVFFDDVKIDKKYLVGKENEGFRQLASANLVYERAGIERLMQNHLVYKELKAYIKENMSSMEDTGLRHWIKDAVAQLEVEFNIGRMLCYYTAWRIDTGRKMDSQAALYKAFSSQYEQRLTDVATKLLGVPSLIMEQESPYAPWEGLAAESYLQGAAFTLQGGSVEILKNILAQRGLGLPRR